MFHVCVVGLCALAIWHLKFWLIELDIETASAFSSASPTHLFHPDTCQLGIPTSAFSLLKCTTTTAWTAPALLLLHSVPLLWPTSSDRQQHWSWWHPQVAASAAAAKALWVRCNNHHLKYSYLALLVFKTKIYDHVNRSNMASNSKKMLLFLAV